MSGLSEAPDGKILFLARSGGGRTIWEMDADGQNQRQLTAADKNSNDELVDVTTDDRTMIFQSDRSGRPEIWRTNRDGTDLRQLTDETDATEPSLVPNGNSFVFVRREEGKSTLWRASIDGGPPRQLTTDETSWPAVSPDGQFVACAYGNSVNSVYRQIALFSIDGGRPLRLFPVSPRAALYNRPTWSTDGKSILYKDETQGLWKQPLNAETPELITGIDDFRFNHLAASATDLIYSGGIIKRDIVVIENFR
jgi:Tol biopolymer transport system component